MFACEQCCKKNEWPTWMMRSYGRCEMCDLVAECIDVPPTFKVKALEEQEQEERKP